MSSFREVIDQLLPVDIGGDWQALVAVLAGRIEAVSSEIERFRREMHPASTSAWLEDWERLYDLEYAKDSPAAERVAVLVLAVAARPRMTVDYYRELAERFGHDDVVVEQVTPFMAGWSVAGDELAPAEAAYFMTFSWLGAPEYYFRAGLGRAGEHLFSPGTDEPLIAALDSLRPAHMIFGYNP